MFIKIFLFIFILLNQHKCNSLKLLSNLASFFHNVLGIDYDIMRDSPQLIKSRNFDVETHKIKTKDGYQVTMFRIINPFFNVKKGKKLPIVLVPNSGFCNSDQYLITAEGKLESDGVYRENDKVDKNDEVITDCNPPINGTTGMTLAFVLASCGYDVWLGNDRATKYANDHITKLRPSYWNFSFVEIARYDISEMIDYILLNTKQEKLNYLGVSKASTEMFVLLSEQPDYADKIERFIALSAVITILDPNLSLRSINPVITRFNQESFPFPNDNFLQLPSFLKNLIKIMSSKVTNYYFSSIYESLSILAEITRLNHSRFGVLLAHQPVSISWFTIVHFNQIISAQRFQYFDYGCSKNREIYRQNNCQPPLIPLKNIKLRKIAIVHSKGDQFCRPIDVEALKGNLSVPLWKEIRMPDNVLHVDYVSHIPTAKMVNAIILNLLKT